MASKVILSGYILVPEDDFQAVRDALPQHIDLTRAEPGNLTFRVTQDSVNPLRFNVYEEFIDQAAFEAHQERTQNSTWGVITQKVERCYEVRSEESS